MQNLARCRQKSFCGLHTETVRRRISSVLPESVFTRSDFADSTSPGAPCFHLSQECNRERGVDDQRQGKRDHCAQRIA